MVTLGSARWGESGGYNQKPGDASGKEVATEPYYTHEYKWNVIRAKSAKQANKLAERMKAACANNNIGYDMNDRYGVIKNGINTKVKTEADCSSLVRQCVIEACGKDPGDFTTANEKTKLMATGLFTDEGSCGSKSEAESKLYTGDILVSKKQGHTVIVVSAKTRVVPNTWVKDSKGWYYIGSNGKSVKNQWVKDSKGWCWIDSTGYWVVGTKWLKIDNEWYYITKGYRDENKWRKDSHGWCYVGADGRWVKSKWIKYKDEWYYIKPNGYMATNEWAKDSHGWCYLGESGAWVKSEWVKWKGYWYYIKANGYMATGTIVIDGKSYVFDSTGKLRKTE